MDKNKFDMFSKNTLEDHEVPVDTNALWENVQAELYPKKKKKFAWIWFSASSFLAVVLFSAYMFFSNEGNQFTASTIHTSNTKEVASHHNIKNNKSARNDKETSTPEDKLSTQASTAERMEQSTSKAENKSDDVKTKSTLTSNKKTKKTNSIKLDAQKQEKVNKNISISKDPPIYVNTENFITETKSSAPLILTESDNDKKEKETVEKLEANIGTSNSLEAEKEEIKIKEGPINEANEIALAEANEEEKLKEVIAANQEGGNNVELEEDAANNETGANEEEEEKEEDEEEIKIKKKFRIGLGFRAGISNSITTLSANGDVNMSFSSLRNQSETNLETIDLGIDVLVKHKSGFYASTGIDYLRAARKFEYESIIVDTTTLQGITAIFVNPITMDSTFQEGLVTETTTTSRRKETYNNLHLINIPLNLGVTLNHERWIFGVQGGATLNVFLNHKGEIQDSESTFYNLGEDSNNWFKDNLGISYQGAAFVGYNFSDNFQIIGGPIFRSPVVISEDSNPVRQSFVGVGLQVSTRYWW